MIDTRNLCFLTAGGLIALTIYVVLLSYTIPKKERGKIVTWRELQAANPSIKSYRGE